MKIAPEGTRLGVGVGEEGLGDRIERQLRDLQLRGPLGNEQRLGVALLPLSEQLAAYFGVKSGVLIAEVLPASPAARANLKPGDVITAINGQRVFSPGDVIAMLRRIDQPGPVDLTLMREKRELHTEVRLNDSRRRRLGEPVGI